MPLSERETAQEIVSGIVGVVADGFLTGNQDLVKKIRSIINRMVDDLPKDELLLVVEELILLAAKLVIDIQTEE